VKKEKVEKVEKVKKEKVKKEPKQRGRPKNETLLPIPKVKAKQISSEATHEIKEYTNNMKISLSTILKEYSKEKRERSVLSWKRQDELVDKYNELFDIMDKKIKEVIQQSIKRGEQTTKIHERYEKFKESQRKRVSKLLENEDEEE